MGWGTVYREDHQGETALKRKGQWVLEGGSEQGQVAQGGPGRDTQGSAQRPMGGEGTSCCGGGWAVLGWARPGMSESQTLQLQPWPRPCPAPGAQAPVPSALTHPSLAHRDEGCDYWIRTFVPSSRPGQFTLGNIKSES